MKLTEKNIGHSRTGFIDEPKPHKVHIRPMPLLGGLAIYLALCVGLMRVDFAAEWLQMAAIAAGATLLMLVGLWDDRRGIAPRVKILAQIVATVLVMAAGIHVQLTPWPALNWRSALGAASSESALGLIPNTAMVFAELRIPARS